MAAIVFLAGCQPEVSKDWTTSLHESLRGATRLRVRAEGTCCNEPDKEETLLDVRDAQEVAKVVQGIRIDPDESGFHCLCCGDPTLEFYRNDTRIASLSFHHGRSLRWPDGPWKGDGLLTQDSANFLIEWLAVRGVEGPRKERDGLLRHERPSNPSRDRWLTEMPAFLTPYWPDRPIFFDADAIRTMNTALTNQFPDEGERILALLNWFGSGAGPWSGFPYYESAAEELLLLHSTDAILKAIGDVELTNRQREGAARLFAGRQFRELRPDDLCLIPDGLKQDLLEHSMNCDDEDKKTQAERAFGKPREATGSDDAEST